MRMKADDIKTYPKFSKYVSTSLPGVANVKSIISAIESISELGDTAAIKSALSWGQGPMVEVMILVDKQVGEYVQSPRAGHTPHTNTIAIRQRDVWDYENGKDLRKTHNGHLVHVVGVQLLHELTHWARERTGKPEEEDVGFEFERQIYGGNVTD